MTAKQRITILVTAREKVEISTRARAAGVSVCEFIRRAAMSYSPKSDIYALGAMVSEMNKATEAAVRAIDDTLTFVAESNDRIAKLEAQVMERGNQSQPLPLPPR